MRLLPTPAGPRMVRSRTRAIVPDAMQHRLRHRQIALPADQRSLRCPSPFEAPAHGDDLPHLPGGHRCPLATQDLVLGPDEQDRISNHPIGRLVDEDRARAGDCLQPGRGVDDIAGDDALADGAQGDGGLTAHDARPRREAGDAEIAAERGDRVDQLDGRSDRPLGVVLASHRRTPQRHHGIAHELLDRPAVAQDDLAADIEVARLEVADLLEITPLGEAGEVDEVGEQDGDLATLGDRGGRRRATVRGGSAACG